MRTAQSTRPLGFRLEDWISPEDLLVAFAEANVKPVPMAKDLGEAAANANGAIRRLVVNLRSPDVKQQVAQLRRQLRYVRRATSHLLRHLGRLFPEGPFERGKQTNGVARLGAARTPAGRALLSAAAPTNPADPAGELASKVEALEQLCEWADTADRAFPDHPRVLESSRDFAWILIEIYEVLGNRKVGFSRESPASSRPGAPSGPLIRFLTQLFSRCREAIAASDDLADLREHRSLDPTPETLASWITAYRKATAKASPPE